MSPILLHIWGPFAIQAYGFFIALGALAFLFFIKRDPRFIKLGLHNTFDTIFLCGAAAVFFGGRALHVWRHYDDYNSWTEWFAFWEPGYAVLGSMAAVAIVVSTYLWMYKIPLVPLLDLIGTYAPLLQAMGRVGCFFAGCCFGCHTTVPWRIMYTDDASLAPTDIFLHPTQLYSAGLLFLIFLFMYFIARRWCIIPGQHAALYLILVSGERFIIDFWRGDREMLSGYSLSFHQLFALGLIFIGILMYCYFTFSKKRPSA